MVLNVTSITIEYYGFEEILELSLPAGESEPTLFRGGSPPEVGLRVARVGSADLVEGRVRRGPVGATRFQA